MPIGDALSDLFDAFGGSNPIKDAAAKEQQEKDRRAAQTVKIGGRTIDGVLYVNALDVATALRTEGLHESVVLRRLRKYLEKGRNG